jgi:hypothetical protein
MNTQSLVKQFRNDLSLNKDIDLDFRRDVFISNQHGNYPQSLSYDNASVIISYLYAWAHEYIDDHKENYPDFGGFQYNLMMSVEQLRTSTLNSVIENVCHDLYVRFTDEYRKDGTSLFKYDSDSKAYIHVYRNDRCKTMTRLIAAYEAACIDQEL